MFIYRELNLWNGEYSIVKRNWEMYVTEQDRFGTPGDWIVVQKWQMDEFEMEEETNDLQL